MADDERPGTPEFWRDEQQHERGEMSRQALRWSLLFFAVFAFVFLAFWWSSSAVHFGASRVQTTTAATWRLWGTVRDARTGAPVPWAQVRDNPAGRPPLTEATADVSGSFELMTVAEPHDVVVSALGYQARKVRVGRNWYLWMPRGSEQVDVTLEPETPSL